MLTVRVPDTKLADTATILRLSGQLTHLNVHGDLDDNGINTIASITKHSGSTLVEITINVSLPVHTRNWFSAFGLNNCTRLKRFTLSGTSPRHEIVIISEDEIKVDDNGVLSLSNVVKYKNTISRSIPAVEHITHGRLDAILQSLDDMDTVPRINPHTIVIAPGGWHFLDHQHINSIASVQSLVFQDFAFEQHRFLDTRGWFEGALARMLRIFRGLTSIHIDTFVHHDGIITLPDNPQLITIDEYEVRGANENAIDAALQFSNFAKIALFDVSNYDSTILRFNQHSIHTLRCNIRQFNAIAVPGLTGISTLFCVPFVVDLDPVAFLVTLTCKRDGSQTILDAEISQCNDDIYHEDCERNGDNNGTSGAKITLRVVNNYKNRKGCSGPLSLMLLKSTEKFWPRMRCDQLTISVQGDPVGAELIAQLLSNTRCSVAHIRADVGMNCCQMFQFCGDFVRKAGASTNLTVNGPSGSQTIFYTNNSHVTGNQ